MDPQQLIDLVTQKKWIAIAALVIGFVVRLLKSDTKIPVDIPPRYRVWLALALGGAAGALDKLVGQEGVTWTAALVQGLLAAVLAIVGHNVVIDSLRGGKELPVPGLTDTPNGGSGSGSGSGSSSGSPKPPTFPPIAGAMVLVMMLTNCALFTKENAPKTILTFEQIACIAANAFVDDAVLATVCQLLTGEERAEGAKLAGVHRVMIKQQLTSIPVYTCGDADAGAGAGAGVRMTPTRVGEAGAL